MAAGGIGSASAAEPADSAVVDLLGLLAYGELTAFERMATDARMSPTLADKIALGNMAVAEFAHFREIQDALARMGVDLEVAMAPFVAPLTEFHNLTAPADWLESLVKAYVGDAIAADFYREIAAFLSPEASKLVLDVLADTGHAAFAAERVRAAIAANPSVAGRLALWARRLVGEALTQAHGVAADREALTGLLADVGDLAAVTGMFDRIMQKHADRMAVLGLSA
jgi:hypothetical protein